MILANVLLKRGGWVWVALCFVILFNFGFGFVFNLVDLILVDGFCLSVCFVRGRLIVSH
jgi:hypothetical protein